MSTPCGQEPVPIEQIEVSAYKIPTDAPESDGTFQWRPRLWSSFTRRPAA